MRRRLPLAAAVSLVAAAALAASWTGLAGSPKPGQSGSPSAVAVASPTPSVPAVSPSGGSSPLPTAPPPTPFAPSGMDRAGIVVRLQAALDRGQLELAAPGIAASVLFPDGRQWTGTAGVADLATQRPLTATTPFAIASVSKTFLAAEILTLVGEGRLTLDAPAVTYLRTTQVNGSALDKRFTVRMLLDHTSGLGDFLVSRTLDRAVQADPTARWTPALTLPLAGPPVAPPGAGYHYSNTNYVLLGLIAEALTGRTLAEEYRARFFDPLALRSASYQGFEPPTAELPTAYRYTSIRLSATPVDVTDGSDIRPFTAITTAAGAAGSVAASPRDLARWARALYGGFVLPESLVAEMVSDAARVDTLKPRYPYGLGVQVLDIDGRISYGHSGRLVGARSLVRWFPTEGIAIAVASNQSRYDLTPVLRDLLAIVAPEEIGGGRTPE